MTEYKIVRYFCDSNIPNETLFTGLTLEEAKEHCKSPQASSDTATGRSFFFLTEECGPWFDGFEEE